MNFAPVKSPQEMIPHNVTISKIRSVKIHPEALFKLNFTPQDVKKKAKNNTEQRKLSDLAVCGWSFLAPALHHCA